MLSYWWGVMAGAVTLSQFALFQVNPELTVPPVYWVMGGIAFIGHLWVWWSEIGHSAWGKRDA